MINLRKYILVILLGVGTSLTSFYAYKSYELRLPLIINVPETFLNQSEWTPIENQIIQTEHKLIIFKWHGYGGDVQMMRNFLNILQDLQSKGKQFYFIIDGLTYSAHANVVCFADKSFLENGASVSYHAMAYESPTGEKLYTVGSAAVNEEYFIFSQCVKKGILSLEDVTTIINDHQMVNINNLNGKIYKTIEPDL